MIKPNSRNHGSSRQRNVDAGKKCKPTYRVVLFEEGEEKKWKIAKADREEMFNLVYGFARQM